VSLIEVDDLYQPVYDEVDEDTYGELVRKRQDEDFVVDDGELPCSSSPRGCVSARE
jgi:hypothetical protein